MHEEKFARWSRYLIYFILATLPLERIPSFEATFPITMTVRLSQVAGLALILINLPQIWRSRQQLLRMPWSWLVAFLGICAISAGFADDIKKALSVVVFTGFMAVLAWVIALRFEREKIGIYLKILIGSALVTCGFGFYQFFGDLLGLPPSLTGLRDFYTKAVFGFPRIQSTGLEPLYFGNFLLIPSAILLLALVVSHWRRWAVIAFIPIATVVWLTVSRGAMVALAFMIIVGLIVCLMQRRFFSAVRIILATGVSVAMAFGLLYLGTHWVIKTKTDQSSHAIENFSKQTTNVSSGESSEGRSVTRQLAVKAFNENPILGIGPGNFGPYAAKEMPQRFTNGTAIVNNEPLELLAETGILGFASLSIFAGVLIGCAIRAAKSSPADHIAVYGVVLALVAIALQYQTFSTLYITHIWVALGLLGGYVLFAHKRRHTG